MLYQTIAEHWPGFRERAEEVGGLPRFVVREVEEYLDCGILERGCLHLKCKACGHSQLVAFSCKRRGLCPSYIGRRMADMAVHLEQSVLPAVPVRHWICSFPWGLRALLGYDRALCADVVAAFAGELSRWLKRRAKRELGLRSVAEAHTGLVVAMQRVDSALRLNVHLHTLAPEQDPQDNAGDQGDTPPPRKPWAWLLRHVFQADLQTCPRCAGPMRWVHAATTQKDIARLLAEHGLGPRPPPSPPSPMASPHGQLRLAFPLSS